MENAFSKWLAIGMVAASSIWCRAADANDPVVARYHFAGTAQLTATNYNKIRKILTQTNSIEYRELVLSRFSKEIAASISEKPAAVHAMLEDLIAHESTGVFGVPGNRPESFVIAVRLPADRAAVWKQNFANAFSNGSGLRARQEGEWFVVARGADLRAVEDKFVANIQKTHRPVPELSGAILEANIDWPRLGSLSTVAALPLKPAMLDVKVAPKGTHLRTEVRAHYSEPVVWKSQPWHLPTETIRDPLVSFTAGQNAAAFMKPQHWATLVGENPLATEFFIWSDLNLPFETGLIWPAKNASRRVQNFGRDLPAKFNDDLKKQDNGRLRYLEQTNQVVWQGLPIIAPFLTSVKEKAGEFIVGGTFVFVNSGPAAPADLWAQFKRNDLVYYDWEVSGPRLAQWRMIEPLLPYFPVHRDPHSAPQPPKNSKSPRSADLIVQEWLSAIIAALSPTKESPANGNVITEVTRTSTTDFTITRSSQLGFTAFEMLVLSHWLADVPLPKLPKPSDLPSAPWPAH